MTAPLNIGVAGAAGQMGRAVISVAGARPDVAIASAFDREAMAGQSIGNLDLTTADAAIAACDVIIDFSTPVVASALEEQAAHLRRPALVIGNPGSIRAHCNRQIRKLLDWRQCIGGTG